MAGRALQGALVVFQIIRQGDLAASDFWLCIAASAYPYVVSRHIICIPTLGAMCRALSIVKPLTVVGRAPLVPCRVCAVDQTCSVVLPVPGIALQQAHVTL